MAVEKLRGDRTFSTLDSKIYNGESFLLFHSFSYRISRKMGKKRCWSFQLFKLAIFHFSTMTTIISLHILLSSRDNGSSRLRITFQSVFLCHRSNSPRHVRSMAKGIVEVTVHGSVVIFPVETRQKLERMRGYVGSWVDNVTQ